MVNQSRKKCKLTNAPCSMFANHEFRSSPNQVNRKVSGSNNTQKFRPHSQHVCLSSNACGLVDHVYFTTFDRTHFEIFDNDFNDLR